MVVAVLGDQTRMRGGVTHVRQVCRVAAPGLMLNDANEGTSVESLDDWWNE